MSAAANPAAAGRLRAAASRARPRKPALNGAPVPDAQKPGGIPGYTLAHEIKAVCTVISRGKREVVFSGSDAWTDNKRIVLPGLASAATYDPYIARVLRGYGNHEAGHCRYTDFQRLPREIEAIKAIAPSPEKESTVQRIHKVFTNIFEDKRLENLLKREFPGTPVENLSATRDYVTKRANEMLEGVVSRLLDPATAAAQAKAFPPIRVLNGALIEICTISNGYACSARNAANVELLRKINPQMVALAEEYRTKIDGLKTEDDVYGLSEEIIKRIVDASQQKAEADEEGGEGGAQPPRQKPEQEGQADQQPGPTGEPQDQEDGGAGEGEGQGKQGESGDEPAGEEESGAGQEPTDQESGDGGNTPGKSPEPSDSDGQAGEDAMDGSGEADGNSAESQEEDAEDGSNASGSPDGQDGDGAEGDESDAEGDESGRNGPGQSEDDPEGGQDGTMPQPDDGKADPPGEQNPEGAESDGESEPDQGQAQDGDGDGSDGSGDGDDAPGGEQGSGDSESESTGQSAGGGDGQAKSPGGPGGEDGLAPGEIGDILDDPAPEEGDGDLDIGDIAKVVAQVTKALNDAIAAKHGKAAAPTEVVDTVYTKIDPSRVREKHVTAHPRISSAIRTMIIAQNKTRISTRREEGDFDHNNVISQATRSPDLYKTVKRSRAVNTALLTLIDRSGSMQETIETAGDIAASLAESAFAFPSLKSAVITYTTTGKAHDKLGIQTLKDFEEPMVKARSRFAAWRRIAADDMGGTPTGEAMLEAVKILESRKEEKKILLLITDGIPANMPLAMASHGLAKAKGMITCLIEIGAHDTCNMPFDIGEVAAGMHDLPEAVVKIAKLSMGPQKRT